ncbi:flagellar basal-body MS-ring/collar protein FliF [Polynucleobacter cosmopolitanus]|uniref:Flagellar M-ring protein n=1 Tax=Polynucleobacter cosmopolitanus TaxID=351345 RepID=A0A229FV64_9BURK|nr:flagellar basal-body MS-ring/collar protein FliF [Polynucleobacter cosmopolitanus]OXL15550.1 flagellar M-ring protein FliF [Polynucleobacter cosmopolitanus]
MPDQENQQRSGFSNFIQSSFGLNIALGAGIALAVGIMAAVFMWSMKTSDYRVLLSNYSDRDGGAIVAALAQMAVPYKFSEDGGTILVPSGQVYDARLKLAAQGLPRGGNIGFELMENQKMGTSQFIEQVNYQRAQEGELARTINSIGSVASSRVHLAIPKPSVFVREKQYPTASVMINLQSGRTLDMGQVNAIVHLVSSSIPELPAKNVTVVDQNGSLLSGKTSDSNDPNKLDPSQLKYVRDIQDNLIKRIEAILTPLLGEGNVKAQVAAEVNFASVEKATETYSPNSNPEKNTIRSQKSNESTSSDPVKGGIPGAASNQAGAGKDANASPAGAATNAKRENIVNYEVDKVVSYTKEPVGGIKRLAVAVVVNLKSSVDEEGKTTQKPLTDDEKAQVTALIKEAVGFSQDRGDTINLTNSEFKQAEKVDIPVDPFWKPYANLSTAKTVLQYLVTAIVLFLLYSKVLKPLMTRMSNASVGGGFAFGAAGAGAGAGAGGFANGAGGTGAGGNAEEEEEEEVDEELDAEAKKIASDLSGLGRNSGSDLKAVQKFGAQNPKAVAAVVKDWINE